MMFRFAQLPSRLMFVFALAIGACGGSDGEAANGGTMPVLGATPAESSLPPAMSATAPLAPDMQTGDALPETMPAEPETMPTAPEVQPETQPDMPPEETAPEEMSAEEMSPEEMLPEEPAEVMFDPEFVWVADFMREKCVACHNMGQNGNLLLPSADISNEEVRGALDGVMAASSDRLIIDPGNAAESQAYIMITNEAGEQFPAETTDRFAAWINAGAPYYVQ